MGLTISSLFSRLFSTKRDVRILMVGLDGAGKTTILYKLRLGEVFSTIPTVGFNVETVHYRNLSFVVWDIGGQGEIRSLWRHYYRSTQGLVYVVDASDRERLAIAREELHAIIADEEMQRSVVLVLANKQDMPNAVSVVQLAEALDMRSLNMPWYVQGTCAIRGDGLHDGLDWLVRIVHEQQ